MIPLPERGRTEDWRRIQKKVAQVLTLRAKEHSGHGKTKAGGKRKENNVGKVHALVFPTPHTCLHDAQQYHSQSPR